MVEDPRVWPKNGRVIPANSLTTVSFECISGFATQSILDLDAERAPCRHSAGRTYTQETCISFCKREYVIKHCGCNPSFLFPSSTISAGILLRRSETFEVNRIGLKRTHCLFRKIATCRVYDAMRADGTFSGNDFNVYSEIQLISGSLIQNKFGFLFEMPAFCSYIH